MARRIVSRRTVRSAGRPRRKLIWARTAITDSLVGATPTVVPINLLSDLSSRMGLTGSSVPAGLTIMRIRGIMQARPVDLTTSARLTVAAKVDGLNEFGVTETAEGPNAEAYDDWFLWEPFVYTGIAGAASTDLAWQRQLSRTIDVRARRRLNEVGQTAWLIAQANNANTWRWSAHLSMLVALP